MSGGAREIFAALPPLEPGDFAYCAELLRRRTAVTLGAGKTTLVEARLLPFVRSLGLKGLDQLVALLRSKPGTSLEEEVVEALLTSETLFFRDLAPFQFLERQVLPDRMAARGAEPLRFWSAACSTGQEPYSLAMALTEAGQRLKGLRFSLLASDISSRNLERARQGRYSQLEVNRGVPTALLLKHFNQVGLDWELRPELKAQVRFRRFSLTGTWPADLDSMDVIFLRNVLIYFEQDARREILARCARLLRPGGYLFLGSAETTYGLSTAYERLSGGPAGAYRLAPQGVSHADQP